MQPSTSHAGLWIAPIAPTWRHFFADGSTQENERNYIDDYMRGFLRHRALPIAFKKKQFVGKSWVVRNWKLYGLVRWEIDNTPPRMHEVVVYRNHLPAQTWHDLWQEGCQVDSADLTQDDWHDRLTAGGRGLFEATIKHFGPPDEAIVRGYIEGERVFVSVDKFHFEPFRGRQGEFNDIFMMGCVYEEGKEYTVAVYRHDLEELVYGEMLWGMLCRKKAMTMAGDVDESYRGLLTSD